MKSELKIFLWAACVAVGALIIGMNVSKAQAGGLGCHVAALGGMTNANTDTSINVTGGPSLADIGGLGSSGATLGAGVGCDLVVDRILVGGFADYVWNHASFKANAMGAAINFDLDKQWTVGGRAGVMVSDATLIYALLGWTQLSTSGVQGIVSGSFGDFSGAVLGGGIETAVGKHVKLGIEYRHASLDSRSADLMYAGSPIGASVLAKPELDSVFARLTIGFDFFGSTLGATQVATK